MAQKCDVEREMSLRNELTPGYAVSLWILGSPVEIRKNAPLVNNVRLFPELRVDSHRGRPTP
jgi:hypothetical protein